LFIKGLTTEVNAYIYGQLELMKMRNNKMNDIAQLMFFIVNAMVWLKCVKYVCQTLTVILRELIVGFYVAQLHV